VMNYSTDSTARSQCALGTQFVFRLDEFHGNSWHATDYRSLGGIADVLRSAF